MTDRSQEPGIIDILQSIDAKLAQIIKDADPAPDGPAAPAPEGRKRFGRKSS